jgi:hypothetical protein
MLMRHLPVLGDLFLFGLHSCSSRCNGMEPPWEGVVVLLRHWWRSLLKMRGEETCMRGSYPWEGELRLRRHLLRSSHRLQERMT